MLVEQLEGHEPQRRAAMTHVVLCVDVLGGMRQFLNEEVVVDGNREPLSLMRFLNDFTEDPSRPHTARKKLAECWGGAAAGCVWWGFMAVDCYDGDEAVAKSEDLLVSYGNDYWSLDTTAQHALQIDLVDEEQQVERKKSKTTKSCSSNCAMEEEDDCLDSDVPMEDVRKARPSPTPNRSLSRAKRKRAPTQPFQIDPLPPPPKKHGKRGRPTTYPKTDKQREKEKGKKKPPPPKKQARNAALRLAGKCVKTKMLDLN